MTGILSSDCIMNHNEPVMVTMIICLLLAPMHALKVTINFNLQTTSLSENNSFLLLLVVAFSGNN